MPEPISFNYDDAFSRNIGWLTDWEQQILRTKKIAIAGVGGVGGVHLLTLTRLGIQNFHIADLDRFEQANFNRQVGAVLDLERRRGQDLIVDVAGREIAELPLRGRGARRRVANRARFLMRVGRAQTEVAGNFVELQRLREVVALRRIRQQVCVAER